jgi:hypothetical protein
MQTKQLLALVALAVGILTIPAAAIAGPAGHSALAQPSDLGPIVAPLSGCMTHLRWVPARGPGGGHYDYSSIASAIHGSTKPIAPRPASHAAAWGFDWGSAGIGAATVLGAFAIALAARTALHRRRIATP